LFHQQLLGALAVGDVQRHPVHAQRRTVRSFQDPPARVQPAHVAVGPHAAELLTVIAALLQGQAKAGLHALAVVAVDRLPQVRLGDRGAGGESEIDLALIGSAQRPGCQVQLPTAETIVTDGRTQALIMLAQGLLRAHALDQIGRLAQVEIEQAQIALGWAVDFAEMVAKGAEAPAGAGDQRRDLEPAIAGVLRDLPFHFAARVLPHVIDDHALTGLQGLAARAVGVAGNIAPAIDHRLGEAAVGHQLQHPVVRIIEVERARVGPEQGNRGVRDLREHGRQIGRHRQARAQRLQPRQRRDLGFPWCGHDFGAAVAVGDRGTVLPLFVTLGVHG